MLSQGYWLCEYLSISRVLKKAPSQYGRSFLYCETDEGDLTYFVHYHLEVVLRAIRELNVYLRRKAKEIREVEQLVRRSPELNINHRQVALLSHALRHPDAVLTIKSHKTCHGVVYQTARADLLDLTRRKLLEKKKSGRTFHFRPPPDLLGTLYGRGLGSGSNQLSR